MEQFTTRHSLRPLLSCNFQTIGKDWTLQPSLPSLIRDLPHLRFFTLWMTLTCVINRVIIIIMSAARPCITHWHLRDLGQWTTWTQTEPCNATNTRQATRKLSCDVCITIKRHGKHPSMQSLSSSYQIQVQSRLRLRDECMKLTSFVFIENVKRFVRSDLLTCAMNVYKLYSQCMHVLHNRLRV